MDIRKLTILLLVTSKGFCMTTQSLSMRKERSVSRCSDLACSDHSLREKALSHAFEPESRVHGNSYLVKVSLKTMQGFFSFFERGMPCRDILDC